MFVSWRERGANPRALAMSAFGRCTPRLVAVSHRMMQGMVALTLAAVSLTGSVAYASWVASGSGPGGGGSVTTGAGNAATSAVSGRNVTLTWPASTYSNGVAVASYLIKRYDAAGAVLQTIISGSCATLVAATTCTQTAVPAGSWRYSVTPAVGNWRGAESAKASATVGSPSLSLTPLLTRATATLSGTAANFITGETLTFRLDSTTGTVLTGTLAGVATPTVVAANGGGAVTVVLPAGTTAGAHTVYGVASPSGESASQAITVDNTPPPAPSITGGPSGTTLATTATFTFTDTESPVTFRCALDGAAAIACTNPAAYTALAAGSHTFSVSAVDVAGNTSAATSRTWTVDATGPVNTVTFPVDGSSYTPAGFTAGCSTPAAIDLCGTTSDPSGVATVRVSIQDATSGLYWNGATFVATEVMLTPAGTTTWTYTLPNVTIPDNTFIVRVYATDTLTNASVTTSTLTIDSVAPPTPTVTSMPASPSASSSATFAFTDTEPGVSFLCRRDGGAATACTSPTTYAGLADGSHTFVVTAVDDAGNAASANTVTWQVDTTSPANTITFPVDGSFYAAAGYNAGCGTAGTGDLCGTTSDTGTGVTQVRVSVQRGSTSLYWNGTTFGAPAENLRTPTGTTSWSLALAAAAFVDGSYTLRVYATDGVGNTRTATSTFTIDTTAPAPSITAFPAASTASSTATFAFTDTEAGVSFACSLDGAPAVACTSPTVYQALTNTAHTFSVVATDALGNTSAATQKLWTVAAAAPGGATTFPVNGTAYTASTYNLGCSSPAGDICGTAPAGTTSVALSIRQVSTGLYWNNTAFASTTEVFVGATGTTSWNYGLTTALQTDGNYTVRYFVTDTSANVSQPSVATTYTIDKTAPSGSPVFTTNTGTSGRPDQGDTIRFTTSEQLAPGSIMSGWTGLSTSVVVQITNGNPDVLTVWNATNSVQLSLGSVNLRRNDFVNAAVTFGLTGTPSTMIQTGSTITVTLGTPNNTGSLTIAAASGIMRWSPATTATDLAGNPMPAGNVDETDNDRDF